MIPFGVVCDLRRLNFAELNIVGTRVYAPVDLETAIGLLAGKRIATEGLVSTHPLADCGALMAELTGGSSRLLKPVIVMSL